jgi:hypothetical protein
MEDATDIFVVTFFFEVKVGFICGDVFGTFATLNMENYYASRRLIRNIDANQSYLF